METPDGGTKSSAPASPETGVDEMEPLSYATLVGREQRSQLPLAMPGQAGLPLSALDPEMLERVAAEIVRRQPNVGAYFYGRRGQKQYGLDILERETPSRQVVYQVKRYQVLTPEQISLAVDEYANPKPRREGDPPPGRRFAAYKFVLVTSAPFEEETALQDTLVKLQDDYDGDLVIDVWGSERLSSLLRDNGPLVSSIFGPGWAEMFCGLAPAPRPADDPQGLGLVENPVMVLNNLAALERNAKEREAEDPAEAARLYGVLADTLAEASFPEHASQRRRSQGQLLRAAGDVAGAFDVFWGLALRHLTAGATTESPFLDHELGLLLPSLDDGQAAKLRILGAAQGWYERGCQLAEAVPALESLAASADPDAALLCCIVLEQAAVDGWSEFDPPYSLVSGTGNTAALLERLRQCASRLSSTDVTVRAGLACALADTGLTAQSSPDDVAAAFEPLARMAGAGRFRHAGGLVTARAALASAMHGDADRAMNLWRQSILLSSGERLYGDVTGSRRALNTIILEQPQPPVDELDTSSSLPNDDRLLAAPQPAELTALAAVRRGELALAFGTARRFLWEARLSGHLAGYRRALVLVGDVLLASGRAPVAALACVAAGDASKAAALANEIPVRLPVEPWAASAARAPQAAAARVIGCQARLYPPEEAERATRILLQLAAGLWAAPIMVPAPQLEAVKALARFGRSLPPSAVDPVLALLEPRLSDGGTLSEETADLLMQLYWAVPGRRADLAPVIAGQLRLEPPPSGLWSLVGNLPQEARAPLAPEVAALADGGNRGALLAMAAWGEATAAVQLAARRAAARLLRRPTRGPVQTWSMTTQFDDAATLMIALVGAAEPVTVSPGDLRPGPGLVRDAATAATMTASAESQSRRAEEAPVVPPNGGPRPVAARPVRDHGRRAPRRRGVCRRQPPPRLQRQSAGAWLRTRAGTVRAANADQPHPGRDRRPAADGASASARRGPRVQRDRPVRDRIAGPPQPRPPRPGSEGPAAHRASRGSRVCLVSRWCRGPRVADWRRSPPSGRRGAITAERRPGSRQVRRGGPRAARRPRSGLRRVRHLPGSPP